jgi:uncharacterized protein YecE (DUF72 family)
MGTFYPEKTKTAQQLPTYLKTFRSVELNNSFYRLPDKSTFENWRQSVPSNFIFSVKASRFITHMKKLNAVSDSVETFLDHAIGLKEKLGPILFQLPPGWKPNLERLENFLQILPKKQRFTFEFRNHFWYMPEVYDLLKKYNAAFCIYELDGHLSPLEITADFVYIRLHGPGAKYQGSYTEETLQGWADRCKEWAKNKDVYIYFDNDQEGYAAFNAQRLIALTS